MRVRTLLPRLAPLVLSACALTAPSPFQPAAPPPLPPSGSAQPAPGTPAPGAPLAAPSPPAYVPAPRQFHLTPASTALVAQAHRQAGSGDFGEAAATLERALRIEPDNPLLWIELGRIRLGENNPLQAEAVGHKALALATGDAPAQASAWHLVADAQRARGRNAEAAEADRHAQAPTAH